MSAPFAWPPARAGSSPALGASRLWSRAPVIDAQRAELGRQLCALCGGGRREALPQATVGGFDAQLPPRLGIHEEELAYVGQLLLLGSLISMAIVSWRLATGASVLSSFADRGSRRRPASARRRARRAIRVGTSAGEVAPSASGSGLWRNSFRSPYVPSRPPRGSSVCGLRSPKVAAPMLLPPRARDDRGRKRSPQPHRL